MLFLLAREHEDSSKPTQQNRGQTNEFYPEEEYRKICKPGLFNDKTSWLLWEEGQQWYGELRDRSIAFADQRLLPEVAADVANKALQTSAWIDCSAVK